MSNQSPALDLATVNPDVAGLVTREWVDQNSACPYAKIGERVYFATPRPSDEHSALSNALGALGIGNVGIQAVPHPRFIELVNLQASNFLNSLDTAAVPAQNIKEIIAKAGVKQDADAELVGR